MTLKELIEKQTELSTMTTFSRAVDRIADQMATEIIKDKVFMQEMQELVRLAFRKTLKELQEEK